jgi:hypothetical protein
MTMSKQGGAKPRPQQFPTLLELLRTERLYQLLRALIAGTIEKMLVQGPQHFTYPLNGDEVLLNDDDLAIVVGSVAKTTGRSRLKPVIQRSRNMGLLVMRLPRRAQTNLMLEMVALLGNLSSEDLSKLPPPLDMQRTATKSAYEKECGYAISLFEAMDNAHQVAIDRCEMGDKYVETSRWRREVRLASGQDLVIEDQRVIIRNGEATFDDVEGVEHTIRFVVERPMNEISSENLLRPSSRPSCSAARGYFL